MHAKKTHEMQPLPKTGAHFFFHIPGKFTHAPAILKRHMFLGALATCFRAMLVTGCLLHTQIQAPTGPAGWVFGFPNSPSFPTKADPVLAAMVCLLLTRMKHLFVEHSIPG